MKKPNILAKRKKPEANTGAENGAQAVTNNSVSHHRDEILSKGRRFKYPLQHSKHRVAIISIVVVIAALALLSLAMILQLYRWQNTSEFTKGVTSVLPFPVAKVNGSYVSYESYLFELTSSLHWQEKYGTTDLNSPDGKRQIEYLKRSALDKALANDIAHTLAKKNNVKVDDKEIDDIINRIKESGGDLNQILGENFDFTESELRRYIRDNILRQKVSKAIDKDAPTRAAEVLAQIKAGKAFAAAAQELSEDLETKQLGGDIGVVEKGRANLPEEVAAKVFSMKPGEVSDVIATSSDYFIVTVTEKVDENRAKVSIIRIKVKDLTKYLEEYRDQKKVSEYIKLEDVTPEQQ